MTALMGADGVHRCTWPGLDAPEYAHYHDTEWGVPCRGRSEAFREADPRRLSGGTVVADDPAEARALPQRVSRLRCERIARYTRQGYRATDGRPGHRPQSLKVEATIDNARAFLKLQEKTSLSAFLWDSRRRQAADQPLQGARRRAAARRTSPQMSKALMKEGFRFVGPTTVYAFMQSMGFVNDHLVGCHRHAACAALQTRWRVG